MAQTGYTGTGGTLGTVIEGGVLYNVHTFTQTGTFTPSSSFPVEYLVVAGGGGGGSNSASGGGGGGGFLAGSATLTSAAAYTATVGAGGGINASGAASSLAGTGLTTVSAVGGGRAGIFYAWNAGEAGQAGGSGGGGSGNYTSSFAGGAGTSGQGFAGGASAAFSNGSYKGGGGGGAGAAGSAAGATSAGNGGIGKVWPAGSTTYYAGGGGGGAIQESGATTGGDGGLGGGGTGNRAAGTSRDGTAGRTNTGGGGGGNWAGGSGIVVIRYQVDTTPVVTSITSPTTSVGKNNTLTISITSGAADGTLVPYTISGVDSSDINGASLTGNLTISGGTASLNLLVTVTINKTLTAVVGGNIITTRLIYLASGTFPESGGTAVYSGVVKSSVSLALDVATSLSKTGVFTYSATRPILTGVVSPKVNYASASSGQSAPATRQILIQ